jgi:hypothetical protein
LGFVASAIRTRKDAIPRLPRYAEKRLMRMVTAAALDAALAVQQGAA